MDLHLKGFGIEELYRLLENIMESSDHTKVIGKTISLTDLEFKHGKMEVNTKGIIEMDRNMEKGNTYGRISPHIMETGWMVK